MKLALQLINACCGAMRELCEYNIIIPSDVMMNIQESHIALEHIFCTLVERCTWGDILRQIIAVSRRMIPSESKDARTQRVLASLYIAVMPSAP
jgi:hypothetical protein